MAFGPLGEGFWVTLASRELMTDNIVKIKGGVHTSADWYMHVLTLSICLRPPRHRAVSCGILYYVAGFNSGFGIQRQVEFKDEITAHRIVVLLVVSLFFWLGLSTVTFHIFLKGSALREDSSFRSNW